MRVAQACPNQGVRRWKKVFVVSGQSVVLMQEGRRFHKVESTREEKCREATLTKSTKLDEARCHRGLHAASLPSLESCHCKQIRKMMESKVTLRTASLLQSESQAQLSCTTGPLYMKSHIFQVIVSSGNVVNSRLHNCGKGHKVTRSILKANLGFEGPISPGTTLSSGLTTPLHRESRL